MKFAIEPIAQEHIGGFHAAVQFVSFVRRIPREVGLAGCPTPCLAIATVAASACDALKKLGWVSTA